MSTHPPKLDYIGRVRAELAEEGDQLQRPRPRREVYVFFSFDLVNSTVYKTVNRSRWPTVISSFYEFVEAGMSKRLARASLWKYVGDELLFYLRVRSLAELRTCVLVAHDLMRDTIVRLHDRFRDTRTVLSVKGCLWCALVDEIEPAELKAQSPQDVGVAEHNMVLAHTTPEGVRQIDFLGPDIDIGFRISHHAARSRLVVSADLAYLLFKERTRDDRIEDGLRIVAYRQLKGVWGDRYYPIIWYEADWGATDKSFWYDEHHRHDIIGEVVGGRKPQPLKGVVKVLEDLDRRETADKLWEFLRAVDARQGGAEEDLITPRVPGLVEVHCVAVVFHPDGRALVALRPELKRRFPHHWEFGCGQLSLSETFGDCLRRTYLEDFSLELDLGSEPTPFKTFSIEDLEERRRIPGIIFVATAMNPDSVAPKRHERIEWVDPKNPDLPSGFSKVSDFDETLRIAVDVWRARKR